MDGVDEPAAMVRIRAPDISTGPRSVRCRGLVVDRHRPNLVSIFPCLESRLSRIALPDLPLHTVSCKSRELAPRSRLFPLDRGPPSGYSHGRRSWKTMPTIDDALRVCEAR